MAPLHFLTEELRGWEFLIGFAAGVLGFIFIIPRMIRKETWRLVAGIASSVVGLLCYALSSSFNDLFGSWKWWNIILYITFSLMVLLLVSSAKSWQNLSFLHHKAHVTMYLFMGSTTIYSFFSDRSQKGKPDAFNLVSCAAFAIMSFSCGFTELVYFFSALVTSQLMKIDLLFGFTGMCFSYFLVIYPRTGTPVEPSYIVITQSTKQRAWKLLIVASTEISIVCLALSCYFKFNFLSGDLMSPSPLKILFLIGFFIYSSLLSNIVLFGETGRHLIVPHFNLHAGYLLICLALMSSCLALFPDALSASMKQDPYFLASAAAFCVPVLGLPKPQPQGLHMVAMKVYIFLAGSLIALVLLVNVWLCFVGIGLSFLPFIFHLYLDATPQSNNEDLYQVMITELASPPPYSNNNDQAAVVIEVELASLQSNSESHHQLQEVTEIHVVPQFSEDEVHHRS
ncbi:hypothetical protein PIB30_019203 [Stylosanthes scabra]|uniref:Uncharacterized protein n=1 Tax=Stylosanthes scabra TaxID=79078 RepID=A0ABU6Q886_9FABA|nr:hypothetical protein [Stylosanthes scabra]